MSMPHEAEPYYLAYDCRYRSAYAQGADRYALPDAEEKVRAIVRRHVERFKLAGKRVIEFGCGEGAAALELARLGCIYRGYDISPAAIEKAAVALSSYPKAKVAVRDVVQGTFPRHAFDAGIDVGCLHMLVTDADRARYLKNVHDCLKPGAPMLFARVGYSENAYERPVADYQQWLRIFGKDVTKPQRRSAQKDGKEIDIMLPLIPYRTRSEQGYRRELAAASFKVSEFETDGEWANILVETR